MARRQRPDEIDGTDHQHAHLVRIDRKVGTLTTYVKQLGAHIMAALDDLRAKVAAGFTKVEENAATTAEIADDVRDLIAKLANGQPGSQEVIDATAEATALLDKLTAQSDALKAIASQHTPTPPLT